MMLATLAIVVCGALNENGGVTLYVGPDGKDGAVGTAEAPLATPLEARDRVRHLRGEGHTGPVTVQLTGTHFLPEGLTLGAEDGGTASNPTVWQGSGDGNTRFYGGVVLEDWEEVAAGLWSAPFPEGREVGEIFEDGDPLAMAAFPRTGYRTVKGSLEGREHEAFQVAPEDLEQLPATLAGALVYIWAGHDWFSITLPVEKLDRDAGVVHLDGRTGYDIRPGNRYRVLNHPEFLTEPGAFVLDREARRILVRTRRGAPPAGRVVAATAPHVVEMAGDADDPVRHVALQGIDLAISRSHAVRITNAEDIGIDRCRIRGAGESGIHVHGAARRVTVERCDIGHLGLHGVTLHGPGVGSDDVNGHHRVHNNRIHHGGRLVGHGCGVYIAQSGHNDVTNNEIHDMPRYGTTIKGMRYQVLREQVEGVTWENRHDFLHSRHNRLAFNHIHRVNLDSQDTGAMEAWGPGRDNVYDHNLIHDVGNVQFDLQMGIYLDDAADYFTVTNNIIYDVRGTKHVVAIYAKGIGNVLENNYLIVTPPMDAAQLSFFMADERADSHVYRRNIFYFTSPGAAIHHFINFSDDRIAESDHNLYWHAGGAPLHFRNAPVTSFEDWKTLFDNRYDNNSVVADPLFVDVENRDFRLKEDSPALDLGIEPIDFDKIGLREDFPARFRP